MLLELLRLRPQQKKSDDKKSNLEIAEIKTQRHPNLKVTH